MELGVRTLVHDGTEIADRLGLSAGLYYDQEKYVSGAFKDVVNAAIGDPDLTQDQVEQRSWGQIWADNPFTQVENADYSKASLDRAAADTRAAWAAEGKDVENSIPLPGAQQVIAVVKQQGGQG